jgi:hypothetical protein
MYATIVGDNGTILHSIDGGNNWLSQASETSNSLFSVFFTDIYNGTAVGNSGTIIHTTNGGENWMSQISGTTNYLRGIIYLDQYNGLVVGGGGIIYTTNRGLSFIDEKQFKRIPQNFQLLQNYPNPFNPSTNISWQSPVGSWQTIKLYDQIGREIDTIVEGYFEEGIHSKLYIFNSTLPSGVYFYQIKAGNYIETKKMILLK